MTDPSCAAPAGRTRDIVLRAAVLAAVPAAAFAATRGAPPVPRDFAAALVPVAAFACWTTYRALHGGSRWLLPIGGMIAGVVPVAARAWYGPAWDGWPSFLRVSALYLWLFLFMAFAAQLAGVARARRARRARPAGA